MSMFDPVLWGFDWESRRDSHGGCLSVNPKSRPCSQIHKSGEYQ